MKTGRGTDDSGAPMSASEYLSITTDFETSQVLTVEEQKLLELINQENLQGEQEFYSKVHCELSVYLFPHRS